MVEKKAQNSMSKLTSGRSFLSLWHSVQSAELQKKFNFFLQGSCSQHCSGHETTAPTPHMSLVGSVHFQLLQGWLEVFNNGRKTQVQLVCPSFLAVGGHRQSTDLCRSCSEPGIVSPAAKGQSKHPQGSWFPSMCFCTKQVYPQGQQMPCEKRTQSSRGKTKSVTVLIAGVITK